ncbi:MAG: NAD(P)/FAD-dependent oxidoreductase [Ruminococcaceae bacterium]|nr:NAD(P)/FAD-dependent oxidoreductase [Oscillospiraceae bacterium]
MKRIVVIGGGAAGLMAAYRAALSDSTVFLIERNERMARKVMITGKGRCNVTNNSDVDTLMANIPRNARFLYSAFSEFNSADTIRFFEENGVPLKTERGQRVFPQSDKAVDIVDALVNAAKRAGVKFLKGRAVEVIANDNAVHAAKLENNEEIEADAVIIATGGMSYSLTGSTGDGYKMAEMLGHTVTELKPSLVPLVAHEGFCSKLSGLSLKNVTLSLFETGKKKPIFSEMGEMLFTHFGISGPLALSASAHIKNLEKKQYFVKIDLKPALSVEQLDKRILRDFEENANKDFLNSLDALLPKSLIPVVVSLSKIPPHQKINQLSREERFRLVEIIKGLTVNIVDYRPIEEAIITSGGVNVREVNPSTMESKLVSGLYFAGEVLDVDAYTGGFNLQIAFSTGFLAGMKAGGEDL